MFALKGEVGAGKSSLINLLLGSQLFPTDPLKCTNTICEIRVSEDGSKAAHVFYKTVTLDNGKETTAPPEKIKLGMITLTAGVRASTKCR